MCLLDYLTVNSTLFDIHSISIPFPFVNAFRQLCFQTQFEQGLVSEMAFNSFSVKLTTEESLHLPFSLLWCQWL